MTGTKTRITAIAVMGFFGATAIASPAWAFGEAGPVTLSEFGGFVVGTDIIEDEEGGKNVTGQSYVGFAKPAEPIYETPLVLIHGGGGQSSDWIATVDGRDGWRNYFLAAGINTYWLDRPGLGRSPAKPTYGPEEAKGMVGQGSYEQIGGLASSENWPGANPVDGEWSREAWLAANPDNEGVLTWMATSPGGPYGGNELARENLVELADQVGPAVLFGHSAGVASTLLAALTAPEGKVKGVLVFEGGVDLLNEANLAAATWEPPLAEGFAPVEVDGCPMQPEDSVSQNVSLANIPIVIIRSEHGNQSDEAFTCAVGQLEQMGVDAKFIQLADVGFPGGGHFMMSDTNSAEIATEVLVPIVNFLANGEPLPEDWTVVD